MFAFGIIYYATTYSIYIILCPVEDEEIELLSDYCDRTPARKSADG